MTLFFRCVTTFVLPVLCAVMPFSISAQQVNVTSSDATPASTSEFTRTHAPALSVLPRVSSQAPPSAQITTATTGPTTDATRAGIAPRTSRDLAVTMTQDPHIGAGQNIAMMIVGGAALVSGLIIGGDGGTIVAVGGAAVGLYGLYNYIK